jgi:hypothetical protein
LVCEIAVLTDIILGEITLGKVGKVMYFFTVCFSFIGIYCEDQKYVVHHPQKQAGPPCTPNLTEKALIRGFGTNSKIWYFEVPFWYFFLAVWYYGLKKSWQPC